MIMTERDWFDGPEGERIRRLIDELPDIAVDYTGHHQVAPAPSFATGDRSLASRDITLTPDGALFVPDAWAGEILSMLLSAFCHLPEDAISPGMRQVLYALSVAAQRHAGGQS